MTSRVRITCLIALALFALTASGRAQSAEEWANLRTDLSEQEMRGRGLLLQRCSLCHLPQGRRLRTAPPRPYGLEFSRLAPELKGSLKDAAPEKERAVRRFIRDGGPRMPGFGYALDSKEIDDLIAFLKIL